MRRETALAIIISRLAGWVVVSARTQYSPLPPPTQAGSDDGRSVREEGSWLSEQLHLRCGVQNPLSEQVEQPSGDLNRSARPRQSAMVVESRWLRSNLGPPLALLVGRRGSSSLLPPPPPPPPLIVDFLIQFRPFSVPLPAKANRTANRTALDSAVDYGAKLPPAGAEPFNAAARGSIICFSGQPNRRRTTATTNVAALGRPNSPTD